MRVLPVFPGCPHSPSPLPATVGVRDGLNEMLLAFSPTPAGVPLWLMQRMTRHLFSCGILVPNISEKNHASM